MESKSMQNTRSLDIINNNSELVLPDSNQNIALSKEYDNLLVKREVRMDSTLCDQEEETESLMDEIEALEKSRVRMSQDFKYLKAKYDKEIEGKENELLEAKNISKKKIAELEHQLENEHIERLKLKRKNSELEKRVISLQSIVNSTNKELPKITKLKKENGRLKILCNSAKNALERNHQEASYKEVNRKLQEQLEDAEYSRNLELEFRQHAERELKDMQETIDESLNEKQLLETKISNIEGEKINLNAALEESNAELHETIRKYEHAINQLSEHQIYVQNQTKEIFNLQEECKALEQNILDMANKEEIKTDENAKQKYICLELKVKELEVKCEFQEVSFNRIKIQNKRLQAAITGMKEERDEIATKERCLQNLVRESKLKIRLLEEDKTEWSIKQSKCEAKKQEYANKLECSEAQTLILRKCLKEQSARLQDLEYSISAGDMENTLVPEDDCDGISDDDVFMGTRRSSISSCAPQQSRMIFDANRSQSQGYSRKSLTNSLSGNLKSLLENPEDRM